MNGDGRGVSDSEDTEVKIRRDCRSEASLGHDSGMSSAEEPESVNRVREFWNEQHEGLDASAAHDNFLAHPLIQTYVSMRAFGGATDGHIDVAIAELRARTEPGDRVLSIGCGTALKEEAIASKLPDRFFVGFDIADKTLDEARERLARNGIQNLKLELGDFNNLDLGQSCWKAILGLGALHHVEALEQFWDRSARGLASGGVVMAQEYVGPDRLQWNSAQVEEGNRALAELVPDEHKVHHREVVPLTLDQMIAIDPSEAVRSSEIVATARACGWVMEGYAGAGCALLQPVLMHQIATFEPTNWSHNRVLAELFEREDRLMRDGVLQDDFAVFVARPS